MVHPLFYELTYWKISLKLYILSAQGFHDWFWNPKCKKLKLFTYYNEPHVTCQSNVWSFSSWIFKARCVQRISAITVGIFQQKPRRGNRLDEKKWKKPEALELFSVKLCFIISPASKAGSATKAHHAWRQHRSKRFIEKLTQILNETGMDWQGIKTPK